jgi:hypothetical protein
MERPKRSADYPPLSRKLSRILQLYIYSPPQCPNRFLSHQNYLPNSTGALPNGIKRPTRSADYSSLHNTCVRNARDLYNYSPPQFHYRLWSHQNYLPNGTGALPKGIKRPTCCADYSSLPNNGVKNPRAIYFFPHSVKNRSGAIKTTYILEPGLFSKG